jgi:hypothetical protein
LEIEPNPDVPPRVAEGFVEFMTKHGYDLSLDLACLQGTIESIIELDLFRDRSGSRHGFEVGSAGITYDAETGLSVYIGEVLARTFDGVWTGHCAPTSGLNFYTLKLSFGDYKASPSWWPAYRISNGPSEGTFEEWLQAVLPSIQARRDLRKRTG